MAHVLAGGAAYVAPEHAMRIARAEDRNRGRRRRLLGRRCGSRRFLGGGCGGGLLGPAPVNVQGDARKQRGCEAATSTGADAHDQVEHRHCASTIETWIWPRLRST